MEFGTVLSVAQTLLSALQCSELKQICCILGYSSQLKNLHDTATTIKAVLIDAEAKQDHLSHAAHLWIQELKDAVYDADDLLDEFSTLVEQKRHLLEQGPHLSNKFSLFFSRFNPLIVAYNMSRGVKKIRKKLDLVASNHREFKFSIDHQPIRRRKQETCSYVYAGRIIGRENDLENIVKLLLDSNNIGFEVSYLTVVGIGGLGKTALAQLLYNDERVATLFPMRLWACVSDHDERELNIEAILGKILASVLGYKDEGLTMERVQTQLRETLATSRYLIVLDDVWTENRSRWLNFADFFMGSHKGSWIVVTTRSRETARIIGNGTTYELQGLSEENSWLLFQRIAFVGSEQSNPENNDLVHIGREIVQGCAGVPLAIRMVGSLLYGQDKNKWLKIWEVGLANIRECENDIMPILKLSYDHLESQLKSCFSYCAVFPKDFEIRKEMLIGLWIAQGYIVPLEEGQSLEDVGNKNFSILLRRCFFQNVKQDEHGEITSCKIHDLIHDIAQKAAGKEICRVTSISDNMDKGIRHLTLIRNDTAKFAFTKAHIRSYLQVGHWNKATKMDHFSLGELLASYMCLRTLDLSNSNVRSLPDSIGGLLHLRYLDLSWNVDLEELPMSIGKLHNLETLILRCCYRLKELPKSLSAMVKLRVLDMEGCSELTYLPKGMGKLTNLHMLTQFRLGKTSSSWKQWVNQLEDLKALDKLKGSLKVKVELPKNGIKAMEDSNNLREGGYLRGKKHLSHIGITFNDKDDEVTGSVSYKELLLECLHPPSNLKVLEISGYNGLRTPDWMAFLPNLVRIELLECKAIQHLSILKTLPHLKVLDLENLPNLEYIESGIALSNAQDQPFFPSLERVRLYNLQKLQGWSKSGMNNGSSFWVQSPFHSISQLKTLFIRGCPSLTSISMCPRLEDLNLWSFNGRLQIMIDTQSDKNLEATVTPSFSCDNPLLQSVPGNSSCISGLKVVRVDNVSWLMSIPKQAFQYLTYMELSNDKEVECLEEIEEVFNNSSASLMSLCIEHYPKLRSLCRGLEKLSALETLYISRCPSLQISEDIDEVSGLPWQFLHQNLQSLQLRDLPKLIKLPKGMQYLTALQNLQIANCKGLESLPDWMPKLTSLSRLDVHSCSAHLRERCQNPAGEDWPKIQHISSFTLL